MRLYLLDLESLYEELGLIGIRIPDRNAYKLVTHSWNLVAKVDLDTGEYELSEGFLDSLSRDGQFKLLKFLYSGEY